MKFEIKNNVAEINLSNGCLIEFVLSDNCLKGIGRVEFNGKKLRSEEEYIFPQISTPDGMQIDKYEFVDIQKRDDCIVIHTKPCFKVAPRMEWSEHAMHLRVNTASWSREAFSPEGACFEWIVREENENFDGIEYSGFSYQFNYTCPRYKIYQIEDKATWELGGAAAGNTFVMRNGCVKPVVTLEKNTYYYTGRDMAGIANPYIFQHLPLYTAMQGFTFQYDRENVLVTVHESPSHVRSLFLKEEGDNKLLHFNQFCFNLADKVATPARKILTSKKQGSSNVDVLNHYLRVRDDILHNIYGYYSIKLDTTRPSAHVETWHIARVDNFDPIFEQLNEWGIKRAFIMPLWRSNETDVLPKFKDDMQRFGILGNMCCPLELEIADCYGGWEGFKKLLSKAVELDISTYMWYGSHFSSLSPLEKKIKGLFARDISGQVNRNNYGHVLFAVDQNNSKYRQYLVDRFKKAKECGLTGVFRDSHFNMATDTINYLHETDEKDQSIVDVITTMHDTEADIQSIFQNQLNMLYYVESPGIIGTPMCGTEYENVRGLEFMYSNMDTGLDYSKVLEFGDDVNMVYFKGLSVRLMYQLHVDVNLFPDRNAIDSWWNPEVMAPMCKAFLKVEPYLNEMSLLGEGRGILWEDGDVQVLFAYCDFYYEAKNSCVTEVVSSKSFMIKDSFHAEKMKIYLIEKR